MAKPRDENIGIAQMLLGKNDDKHCPSRREVYAEILEALILALVAISTAWSGYQASQWGGQQTELFYEANNLSLLAEELVLVDGQENIYNTDTLSAWLTAKMLGHEEIAEIYERRFLPEYKIAFDAWIKTDPINNSQSPSGPRYMSEYRSSKMEEAKKIFEEVSIKSNKGIAALSIAHDYVRNTVSLAIVLVLVAINQRFEIRLIRRGLILLSLGLLAYCLANLFMLPRL